MKKYFNQSGTRQHLRQTRYGFRETCKKNVCTSCHMTYRSYNQLNLDSQTNKVFSTFIFNWTFCDKTASHPKKLKASVSAPVVRSKPNDVQTTSTRLYLWCLVIIILCFQWTVWLMSNTGTSKHLVSCQQALCFCFCSTCHEEELLLAQVCLCGEALVPVRMWPPA